MKRLGKISEDVQQVNARDRLYAYVYLDAANPPSEVMPHWNDDGGWEHRAYWGRTISDSE